MNDDWQVVALEEVVDILDARRRPVNSNERQQRVGDVPYYGATGQAGWIDDSIFDERLVLLGEDAVDFGNPDASKAYVIEGPSWVNNHAHVLRARESAVLTDFLCHSLNVVDYSDYVAFGTRSKLTQGNMRGISLTIPPLPVQRRIVDLMAHLDNQIANLRLERDAGRGLRKATLSNLLDATREIPADYDAAFDLAFPAPQASPTSELAMNEWASAKLEEVCAIRSSRRVLQSQWTSEGVPFWRGREVTSLALTGSVSPDLFISKRHYEELKNRSGVPLQGDLLLTAIGTIGNAWVVPDDSPRYFKDASVLWLSPDPSMDGKFLKYWFESREFLSQVVRGNGTTVDTLTIAGLSGMQITCPPLPVQHRIVDLMAHLDNQIAGMDMEVSTLESLRRQLLASLLSQGVELPASYDLLLEGVA